MPYIGSNRIFNVTSKGDSAFIRYSAYSDGTDFTETRSAGQNYIGFATGQTAPTDKEAYTWILELSETYGYDIFANALVGKANAIYAKLDNVSPLAHKVKVDMSSVPDGATATVKSCGKNLISTNKITFPLASEFVTIWEGSLTGSFVFSFDANAYRYSTGSTILFRLTIDGAQQNIVPNSIDANTGVGTKSFSGMLTKIEICNWSGPTAGSYIDKIQLEVGTTRTDFEAYVEGETVSITGGQEVELNSISPNMTIYNDFAVVAPITYNKDANRVIEKLTQAIISLGGNV